MTPLPHHPSLTLLPEGAIFLKASSTLVVADVHLGKAAAFRAHGLPVPEGDTARDLQRLLSLSQSTRARQLVIAGDLFHSPAGITPELELTIASFLTALKIPLILVVGNHDVKIPAGTLAINRVPHFDSEENIRIIHDPADANDRQFHISGHWHPVVKIADGSPGSLRFRCFVCRNQMLVLPAFGSFTGGARITPMPNDRIFVTLRNQVIELPGELI